MSANLPVVGRHEHKETCKVNTKTKQLKHKCITTVCALSAAILCGAARAEEPVGDNPGEGLEAEEESIVSAEFSLAFDTKYLSYGFVDNNEPILTPSGYLTFFDWVTIGSYALFDVSRYGRRAGYKDRSWKAIEYHPTVNIGHSYSPEDFEWLPTTVEFSFGYDYEYHPRVCTGAQWIDGEYCEGQPRGGDTHFFTFELTLPDLWLEPHFLYERDAMRDHGTYLNLELGHTFALIEGAEEDDDPVLALKPSIAQGWGNAQRIRAYASRQYGYLYEEDEDGNLVSEENWEALDYPALLDTMVKLNLTWNVCENFSIGAYIGYSDFLFDEGVRDAARNYEATGDWTESWNFIGGVALTASF